MRTVLNVAEALLWLFCYPPSVTYTHGVQPPASAASYIEGLDWEARFKHSWPAFILSYYMSHWISSNLESWASQMSFMYFKWLKSSTEEGSFLVVLQVKRSKPSPAVSHLSTSPEPVLPHLLPNSLDSSMQPRGRQSNKIQLVSRYNHQTLARQRPCWTLDSQMWRLWKPWIHSFYLSH